jgi:hypothetical protein
LALDGEELSLPAGDARFAIPLPFDPAPRQLQMVWTASEPSWDPPVFANGDKQLTGDPVLWSAIASPGERIEVALTESMAAHNLKRADALLRIVADRESSGWSDESLQRISARVLRRVRLADTAIAGPRSDAFAAERGPNGIALSEWATRLREQAQALRGARPASAVPPVREPTFDKLPFAHLFQMGTPVRWSVASQASPPEVRVLVASSWNPIPTLASFGLIAIAVIVLGGLMLLFSRSTRPEQAAVIGLLGAAAFGPSEGFLFLGLAALALFVRVAWTGNRVYRWLGG